MSTITFQHLVAGVATAPTSIVLSSSDGLYGIKNVDTGAYPVADGTAVDGSAGDYSYTTTSLPSGNYLAVWEVLYNGVTTYYQHTFSIDAAESVRDGVTLREIEQEVAELVGPYGEYETDGNGTTSALTCNELISSLDLGGLEDLYLYRRGRKADGSAISIPTADKVRLIASIDTATGTITPDRVWSQAPVDSEMFELHHLHPIRELRRAVVEGLKRCYLMDYVSITTSSAAVERNLTSSASYITRERQVRRVQFTYPNQQTYMPKDVGWFETHMSGGDVYIRSARDPYPNPLRVTVLRPAHTYVNGATSVSGPDDDDDLVSVSKDYAASAAIVEAWKRFRHRLMPVAQTGMRMSLPEAVQWFTQQSLSYVKDGPVEMKFDYPMGYYGPQLP